ncbi:odorant receptor 4-like isoform X2 [Athalia rosae]|uniref:odorant receptor 4-like isoform X2 n=1 Tax=Athalia rosae TaxID=37344 RepID=UPI002033AB4B|nr:odorant receptor 4-like isoform X2 [Athalia rosae]
MENEKRIDSEKNFSPLSAIAGKLETSREEFRPVKRNYANFNFRLLQMLGLWNPYDEGILSWLYGLYTSTVYSILVILYTLLEVVDAATITNDLQLFTENICLTMTHLAGIAKLTNLLMRKAKIRAMVEILEIDLRQRDEGEIGEVQDKAIAGAIRKSKTITKSFLVLIGFTATAGMTYPFWDQSYKEWKFPYRCYFPMQTNHSMVYWPAFVFIGISVTLQALMILAHDALFIVFMIHIVSQINILKIKIETLHKVRSFDKTGEQTSGIIEIARRKDNEAWNTTLNTCIKYHQGIIKLVSELEGMFSNVILLQFGTSLIIIGLTGFQVTVSAHRGGRFLPMLAYLCCILLELLLYCWYGNEIIVEVKSHPRISASVCFRMGVITVRTLCVRLFFMTRFDYAERKFNECGLFEWLVSRRRVVRQNCKDLHGENSKAARCHSWKFL